MRGRTPLHAICSVVQIGLPGFAAATILVMSPTTLMSLFAAAARAAPPAPNRVDVDAVDVARRRVRLERRRGQQPVCSALCDRRVARRLDDRERVIGIELIEVLVAPRRALRGDVAVRRLVCALPHAEPGVALEGVDDSVSSALFASVLSTPASASQSCMPCCRATSSLCRTLSICSAADLAAHGVVAREVDPGAGDLRPRGAAARCLAVDGRWVGERPSGKIAFPPEIRLPVFGSIRETATTGACRVQNASGACNQREAVEASSSMGSAGRRLVAVRERQELKGARHASSSRRCGSVSKRCRGCAGSACSTSRPFCRTYTTGVTTPSAAYSTATAHESPPRST